MKIKELTLLTLVFCFCFRTDVWADLIELSNGDRLTGTVKSLEGDKLVIVTEYAGEISIDWSVVKSFGSTEERAIGLESGESLTGSLTLSETGAIALKTEQEVVSVGRSEIVAFGPLPQPQEYGLLEGWNGGVKWGLALSRGNTDLSSLSFATDPVRQTETDRVALNFSSLKSKKDGVSDADLYRAGARYDRFFTDQAFVYGMFGFDKDAEAALDYRLREGGGLGYEFRPAEHTKFSVFGGIAFFQERFEEMDRISETEGSVAVEMSSSFLDPMSLTARSRLSPVFGEDRYFFEFGSGVSVPLFSSLNFGLEFVELYDSAPPEGTKQNDTRLLTTLGWTF